MCYAEDLKNLSISVFTQVHRWSLPQDRGPQPNISDPVALRPILILFSHTGLNLTSSLLPSTFPIKNTIYVPIRQIFNDLDRHGLCL
jgi:hypothetical protein